MKKIILLLVVAVALVSLAVFHSRNTNSAQKIEVKVGDTTILADVSRTDATREQGLSGRPSLSDGEGMLFIFDTPAQYGFWMKDMNFPIDIVWISAQKKIVGVEASVSPSTFPQIFTPKEPILYVLELPAGFAKKEHIDIGGAVFFGS